MSGDSRKGDSRRRFSVVHLWDKGLIMISASASALASACIGMNHEMNEMNEIRSQQINNKYQTSTRTKNRINTNPASSIHLSIHPMDLGNLKHHTARTCIFNTIAELPPCIMHAPIYLHLARFDILRKQNRCATVD